MSETIHDVLRRVFTEMNEQETSKQILGFADYACCTTCASSESYNEVTKKNKQRKSDGVANSDELIFGCINWHEQETDSVLEHRPNETWLGYGILDEDGETAVDDVNNPVRFDKFMNLVKERLESYDGIKVEVPETIHRKIKVSKVN